MNCPKLPAIFAVALCASTSLAFGASPEPAALKRAYDAASRIVNHESTFSGFKIGNSPEDAAALEQQWTLAAEWLSLSLSGQSTLDEKQVSAKLHEIDSRLETDVLSLEPDIYLIGIRRDEIGTVFVLRRIDNHFQAVWNIREMTKRDLDQFPQLAAWSAQLASDDCFTKKRDSAGRRCGPMFTDKLGVLPRDRKGRPRFYVDAGYSQQIGETVGSQLSIWTWDGSRAVPLMAQSYGQMIDVPGEPELRNDVLRVRTKEEFTNFFSCGECRGRQMDWSIRIGPDGVQDLGRTSTMPELDSLDLLVERLVHRRPTAELASEDVAAAMAAVVKKQKATLASYPNSDSNYFSLGMLQNGEVEADPSAPKETLLCFSTDDLDSPFLFTLVSRQKGYFISSVRSLGDHDTPDKLCGRRSIF